MALFLAIDAGGTKADYVLADGEKVLARVRSGSIKRMRVPAGVATGHLEKALAELSAQSGRSLLAVKRTCVGTAGETVPLVTDWLRAELSRRVGGELVIVGDVEIALDAAFQGGPGVLALAGTGSNTAARGQDGQLLGAGGWGPLMADQGSGNRIGLGGLRRGFLARDEGRQTVLLDGALRFWELGSLDELVAFGNSVPPPDFSRFAEIVVQAAAAGDEVAAEVLASEGRELGYLVRLLVRRAGLHASPAVAFAGSILEHVPPVRNALLAEVRSEFPRASEVPGVVDPVMGALWRARQGAV